MPLQAAFPGLQQDIEAAFKKLRDAAKQDATEAGDNSDQVILQVSMDLAVAIHKYVLSAQVVATGGGPVTGVAGPLAPVGACPIVGASVVTTSGNLL
tara:strand:- start:817 stop:1107 length:291 start_codon:yes stop_codon:yes gene_type:complete